MVSFCYPFKRQAPLSPLPLSRPLSTTRRCAFRFCPLQSINTLVRIRSIQNQLFAITDSVETTDCAFAWNSLCTIPASFSNSQLAPSSIVVEFKLRQRRSALTLIQFDLLHQLRLQRRLTVLVRYLPSYLTQVEKSATARRRNSKK